MGRAPRIDVGGHVYHVINRANARAQIFFTPDDYLDFEYLLKEMRDTYDVQMLAYCIMPNHWHLLLIPQRDGSLGHAMQWLGTTHARRHHTRKKTVGGGHLYQGRYKSFLVEEDHHLLTVLKYIERNAARAKLVDRAQDWRWGSAHRRIHGEPHGQVLLSVPPVDLPKAYEAWINDPEPSEDLDLVRESVNKGISYGQVPILGPMVKKENITPHKSRF